jgi:tetratricopeptide (TPR) repeat protein
MCSPTQLGFDHAAARDLGARVMAIGHEYGYAYWVMLGSSYTTAAEPDSAPDPAFLEHTVATLRVMGQQAFVPSHLSRLAELYADVGDLGQALDVIEAALENVHKTGEMLHLPELLRQRASYLLVLGEVDDAVADLEEAVRVATEQGATVTRLRAAIAAAEIPEPQRPAAWRSTLEAALGAAPLAREVASARRLLG